MEVSQELYNSVRDGEHCAPIYMPAYAALRQSPLAQNIFALWSYRLWKPLKHPAIIPARVLHSIFGQDVKDLHDFWRRFKIAAKKVHEKYPDARVEFIGDKRNPVTWAMKLESSPPRIPHKKLFHITGAPQEPRKSPAKVLPPPKKTTTSTSRTIPLTTAQIESLRTEFPGMDIEGLFKDQFWPWLLETTTEPSKNTFPRFRGWLKGKKERSGL